MPSPFPGMDPFLEKHWGDVHTSLVTYDSIEPRYRTPYRVVVRRGWRRMQVDYYPISLGDRLPSIKVPLRPADRDVPLHLQALIKQCYDNGGYDDIDYTADFEPPLAPAANRWAAQLLRRAGRLPVRKRRS